MIHPDDDGSSTWRTGTKVPILAQFSCFTSTKKYKYGRNWRNCLAVLLLADDEGKLADDEMSRASCSRHHEGKLLWKYTSFFQAPS